jgi:antitoxin component of MazEF toxin-antitoxin module
VISAGGGLRLRVRGSDVIIPVMTHKLIAIGNSRGIILSRTLLAEAGLDRSSEVDVTVDDGRIVIEPKAPSDPIAALRAKLVGVDPETLDAVLAAASKKVRATSLRTRRRRRAR